jgi:putative transposase
MQFVANHLYHIYNQGNNQETMFLDKDDYMNFLQKFREFVSPYGNTFFELIDISKDNFLVIDDDKTNGLYL